MLTHFEFRTEISVGEHIQMFRVSLGVIGRSDSQEAIDISEKSAAMVKIFEGYLKEGILKPLAYQTVEGTGWDKVIEGIALLESGKAAKKIVVKV